MEIGKDFKAVLDELDRCVVTKGFGYLNALGADLKDFVLLVLHCTGDNIFNQAKD